MEMILPLQVASHLLVRNRKGLTKPIDVISRKTLIGWIIRQLLACTLLEPTENANFANKVQYPGSHSVCVPAVSKNFQIDLGSLDPSYRENSMELTFWCLFAFPCAYGAFPTVTQVRGNFYLKITIKQGFQVVCYSQQTEFWETYFPSMNERQNKRMFFRHLSISNSLDSKMWEFQVCTEALISTVTASMFPNISKPCEPIPR